MGQKLSHLRGIFGVMENGGNAVLPVSAHHVSNAESCVNNENRDTILEGMPTFLPLNMPRVEHVTTSENSATAEMADDIFETIYNHGPEVPKQSEENGNTVVCEASCSGLGGASSCSCPRNFEPCVCEKATTSPNKNISPLYNSNVVDTKQLRKESTKTSSHTSSKRSRGKSLRPSKDSAGGSKKKRSHWVLKFNCARLKSGSSCGGAGVDTDIPEPNLGCNSCVCTGYRRTEEHHLGAGVVFETLAQEHQKQSRAILTNEHDESGDDVSAPTTDSSNDVVKFIAEEYPVEDCDERARLERAREIAEGVEPPPGFCPGQHIQLICPPALTLDNLTALFQTHLGIHSALSALSQIDVTLASAFSRGVHTQVDYIHCLVPDILQITSCSFYWGKMDRYEAERLLEGRPEGTFLLRDSAQEEYLFSVSFRKYGRSLHARIEQWNHRFSFDSHDPGVYASPTVCGLIEHYKDPSCCMFFEPMLTIPLHRNFPFPLQHLCRAVICSKATYDGVTQLHLPKALKGYLKEYHYKQRVRVRIFDLEP